MNLTASLYFILFTCFASLAQEVNEWENPLVYERNKLQPHTDFIAYTTETDARADVFSTSPYYQSLNGTWKFNFVKKPEDRPRDFYKTGFDDSGWDRISVPGNWELEGFGIPIFEATSNIPRIPTVVLTTNLPVLIPAFLNSPCRMLLGIVKSEEILISTLLVPVLTDDGNFL